MTDTSKTAKVVKTWCTPPSHQLCVSVMLNNITFNVFGTSVCNSRFFASLNFNGTHIVTLQNRNVARISQIVKGAVRRSMNLANFYGGGLVSCENRRMKSLNHDICHFSRHDSDDKKWQTTKTQTLWCCLWCWLWNDIKSGPYGAYIVHLFKS